MSHASSPLHVFLFEFLHTWSLPLRATYHAHLILHLVKAFLLDSDIIIIIIIIIIERIEFVKEYCSFFPGSQAAAACSW